MLRDGALEGQTIIVTGGGTGLGRSMGKYMLELGANLVITSRKMEVLEKAAAFGCARHVPCESFIACVEYHTLLLLRGPAHCTPGLQKRIAVRRPRIRRVASAAAVSLVFVRRIISIEPIQ